MNTTANDQTPPDRPARYEASFVLAPPFPPFPVSGPPDPDRRSTRYRIYRIDDPDQ